MIRKENGVSVYENEMYKFLSEKFVPKELVQGLMQVCGQVS